MSIKSVTDKIPTRLTLAIMLFTACMMSYMLRVNISINIIAMVDTRASNNGQQKATVSECLVQNPFNQSLTGNSSATVRRNTPLPNYGPRYDWDQPIQGLILGSYFWGYVIMSAPGGYLAERFGAVRVVGSSVVLSALLTLLSPIAARTHYILLIICRLLIGLFSGVQYPGLHCLISKWVPAIEKGKFMSALLGGTFGTVLTWPFCGHIIETLGWEWAFYIPGGIALFWALFWFFLLTETPDEHPRISEKEKEYIRSHIGNTVEKQKKTPPYLKMFTSVPYLALIILHYGNMWGLYFLITAGPKYMSEVLGFNIKASGGLASLPYLARVCLGFVFGFTSDIVLRKKWLTVTGVRKFFCVFSHILPGMFLIFITLVGCNATLAVLFVTLSLGMNGASSITNLQNAQDLAPNFAGSVYGLMNCLAGTSGFISPVLVGFITKTQNGLPEWHLIFAIGATVYLISAIVFLFFGSGEIQPWNNTDNKINNLETEKTVENGSETYKNKYVEERTSDQGHTNPAFDDEKL